MKCDKCGKLNLEGSTSCKFCGSQFSEEKTNKKSNKKILVILLSVIILCTIVIACFMVSKMIPLKYHGTFVRINYIQGIEEIETYKISAFSIDYSSNFMGETRKEKIKYLKKNDDLILLEEKDNLSIIEDSYAIIDNDLLFIESSKDEEEIALSKKYNSFFWNVKSDKSDIYEIENKSSDFVDNLEGIANSWSREFVYSTFEEEVNDSNLYIKQSDEKNDETNLNSLELNFEVANGDLSLTFDRKEKKLNSIHFYGYVSVNNFSFSSDTMKVKDMYDCEAILLAAMYAISNIENVSITDGNKYKIEALEDYINLLENKEDNASDNLKNDFSLVNDKYEVKFSRDISGNNYSIYGGISWSIYLK